MKQVLFDTNIILDIALRRVPYFDNAQKLFALIDKGVIIGYVTASSITATISPRKKKGTPLLYRLSQT